MVRPAWTHYDLDLRAESLSDDDPTREMPRFVRTRASRVSPHMNPGAPRRADHTCFLCRRAVVARNQSQPFESFLRSPSSWPRYAMGGVQYLVHHAYEGKPNPWADNFDRLLKYRDIRLKDEAKVRFRRRRRGRPEEFTKRFFLFFFLPAAPPNQTIRAAFV